jgi:Asp-tRNA(Asn)/Glu-tRNA(Gln) amidotransferase B subunit
MEEANIQIHNPDEFECDIPQFVFQQDNAPSHASQWTIQELKKAGIPLLELVGNSLDMTAIESAWVPVRISIT